MTATVSSITICNGFLQISLKLLNLLFYNFAGAVVMEILRFGQNQFFLFSCKIQLHTILLRVMTATVSSITICNGFLQISLKLLNLLFYNFAGAVVMEILRFGQNQFFLFSSGWCSSGTCPWYPMQNIQASNLMRMLHFVMIVVNMYANWSRKAQILRRSVESQVKVTRKVMRCKKIKHHNFDSKINGEIPTQLPHLAAKKFPENLCISLVNRLQAS